MNKDHTDSDNSAKSQGADAGKKTKAPPPTRGETTFNMVDWWGIGWLANMLSSLWLSDKATKLDWQPRLNWLTHKVVKQWPLRSGDAAEGSEYVQQFNKITKAIFEHPDYKHLGDGIEWSSTTLEASKNLQAEEGFRGLFNRIGKAADIHAFVKKHPTLSTEFAEHSVKDIERVMKAGFRYHNALGKAKSVAALMMLCGGGYLVMAPVKWLEDNKKDIVCWLDNKIGPKNPDAKTKEQIEARHEFLAHEPKQSWTSVMLSRTAVMPLVYLVHFNVGSRDNIVNRMHYRNGEKDVKFGGLDSISNRIGGHLFDRMTSYDNPRLRQWTLSKEAEMGRPVMEVNEVLQARARAGNKFAEEVVEKGYYDYKKDAAGNLDLAANGRNRLQGVVNNLFLESVYSFSVATTTFLFSRLLAPIFGIKSDEQKALEKMSQSKELEAVLESKRPLPEPLTTRQNIAEASKVITNRVGEEGWKEQADQAPALKPKDEGLPSAVISSAQHMDALQGHTQQTQIS